MLNKNPWWWAPPTWPERMVATSPSASLVSFLPNFPHLQYPIYSRGCWSTVLLIQGGLQLLTQDPSLKYSAWASKIQSQASWYFNHSLKNTTQAFKKNHPRLYNPGLMNTTYPGLEYTRPSLEYTTKSLEYTTKASRIYPISQSWACACKFVLAHATTLHMFEAVASCATALYIRPYS